MICQMYIRFPYEELEKQIEIFYSHQTVASGRSKCQKKKKSIRDLLQNYLANYAIRNVHKDIQKVIFYDSKFPEKESMKASSHLPRQSLERNAIILLPEKVITLEEILLSEINVSGVDSVQQNRFSIQNVILCCLIFFPSCVLIDLLVLVLDFLDLCVCVLFFYYYF